VELTQSLGNRLYKDRFFKGVVIVLSGLLIAPLLFILMYILKQGISVLNWSFFTQLPQPVGEIGGGVSNAIVGTLMLIGIASVISIPLGILTGTYLAENKQSKLSEFARLCNDVLQGVPSIVMGIIAYVWIVIPMGSFSALSGGIALGLMMLPIVTKTTEETLYMIPNSLKEAAYALGAPYYKTILTVILPSAKSGISSGILLGLARISGETAPLLFTAFGNPFLNFNIMKSVNSLPLLIFNYATSPYEDWQRLAWGSSLLLVIFVLLLSLLSKVVNRS
jgi:phosphate transport system permease protein